MIKKYSHPGVEKDFQIRELVLTENKYENIPQLIDSTLLSPSINHAEILKLCQSCQDYPFRSVCVPPCYVIDAVHMLKNLQSEVCTVIGFPNGYQSCASKCFEIQQALELGATEIDFVQNLSYVKSDNFNDLAKEFREIVLAASVKNALVKVILETSFLTDIEIYNCSYLAAECGLHMIKTSTGFFERGASLNDIQIINTALLNFNEKSGIQLGIKASGGIRDAQQMWNFIHAGVTRIGTSQGIKIIKNI